MSSMKQFACASITLIGLAIGSSAGSAPLAADHGMRLLGEAKASPVLCGRLAYLCSIGQEGACVKWEQYCSQ